MLQNMPLMFHCNKCNIFCNKISIYKCFILARTGQMPEVFLIAFGEIAGTGETKFQSDLLDGHIRCTEQFISSYQSPLTDIIQRSLPGYRFHSTKELRAA